MQQQLGQDGSSSKQAQHTATGEELAASAETATVTHT
jgi:hypothetical protein